MLLTVLGTATPYPRPDNPCSGYLLQSTPAEAVLAGEADPARTTVWIDAGSGTLAELQRHTSLHELSAIWISHRHADHSADLLVAYYALRFAEERPRHPIPLIGPEGLLDRLAAFLGPSSVAELPTVFDFRPMSGWGEARFGELALSWGPVQHGVPAFGLTVDGDGSRFAYSGDSAPCISLEEIAENADLLLIEAGYDRDPAALPASQAGPGAGRRPHDDEPEAPAHHTPEQAGRVAAAAGVARLVLTHVAASVTPADAVARAAAHFAGPISYATPGATYPL